MISILDFTPERIQEILDENPRMGILERQFLQTDTVKYEECDKSIAELKMLCDSELMLYCHHVWLQFAQNL